MIYDVATLSLSTVGSACLSVASTVNKQDGYQDDDDSSTYKTVTFGMDYTRDDAA